MRLALRLFALLILLVIATVPNFTSITTFAEEGGNPCLEGCINEETSCTGGCGYNMSCVQNCKKQYDKCAAGCAPLND